MMSIRSLADFNGGPLGGAVTGETPPPSPPRAPPSARHDEGPGTSTWPPAGTSPGHPRGPLPGHYRGLFHGHGHPCRSPGEACSVEQHTVHRGGAMSSRTDGDGFLPIRYLLPETVIK